MSTFERLNRHILKIDEVTAGAMLSTGKSSTSERIALVKSLEKIKKMRAPAESMTQILVGRFHHSKLYQLRYALSSHLYFFLKQASNDSTVRQSKF